MMRYDLLVQRAMRDVVRKVVSDIAELGHLPGEHHFYLTFDTTNPSTGISERLKSQYPEQMTIVLQHQFWDLTVTEESIDVGLSFDQIPEQLSIPFEALRGFYDPSVNFGLQFEAQTINGEEIGQSDVASNSQDDPAAETQDQTSETQTDSPKADEDGAEEEPKIISLDQFRKKP